MIDGRHCDRTLTRAWMAAGFGPFASLRMAAGLATAIVLLLVAFHLHPHVDIAVSRLFFQPHPCDGEAAAADQICGRFVLRDSHVLNRLRDVLQIAPMAIAAIIIASVIMCGWHGVLAASSSVYLAPLTALASLALGPGLLVNGILKEHSGRPRPIDTVLFGGEWPFIAAGRFTNHCQDNCSFVSGEASTAFWLLCLVPLLPRLYRRELMAALIATVAVMASMRIAFGAHYLSDVLIGGLSTLFIHSSLSIIVTLDKRSLITGAARRSAINRTLRPAPVGPETDRS